MNYDINKMIKEAQQNGGKNLLSKLSPADSAKISALLSDKEALGKILSSDKAKEIMERLNNGRPE